MNSKPWRENTKSGIYFFLKYVPLALKHIDILTATVCKTCNCTAVIEDYIRLKLNTEVVSTCCFGVKCIWNAFDLHILRKTLVKVAPIKQQEDFILIKTMHYRQLCFQIEMLFKNLFPSHCLRLKLPAKNCVLSSRSLILTIFLYFGALLTYWCCSTELIINFITLLFLHY